ncbi:sensor domain-containing diguanylate cyclase [Ramlibacter albus]|uniref:Diguanylate cyclase n=1 Tax=Ramlibacter albus TaxID=2079448 RepID=A0A923M3E5_9BURK|nr:7TM diverse intracellular signaling domain-containing protein [Ramlibacter albus]MBC5763188.1 diguanylate cyclase [Ramlibacter albus]
MSVPESQADDFIRMLVRLAGATLVLLACGGAFAQNTPQRLQPIVLQGALEAIDAEMLGEAWVDPTGTATITQVNSAHGPVKFVQPQADTIYSLGPQAVLWLHYRIARPRDERQNWLLEVPMPLVDLVTVFQHDGNRWHAESAGDNLAVAQWPEPGRHPFFRLDLQPGQVRDVYVRIRHTTAVNFPVRLATEAWHNQRIQLEYLGLGMTFGALVLLIAACLAQSWVYRDRVYAWYAAYATVTTLAVATYTGVAPHLLWPRFGALGDSPQAMLAFVAAAAALLFVRNLIGLPTRFQLVDRVIYGLGIAGLALALTPPFMSKMVGLSLLGGYVVLTVLINIVIALVAWRRGDVVGQWVLYAYLPLTLAVLMSVMRIFGWVPLSFGTQYAVVVAMAIEVPLLLVALSIRSRERHGAQIREQALSTQDALTGLLAPHLFNDRMQQVVSRYKRDQESAAIVFIDLVNYPRIKDYYGSAVAEQSLLRSVIKLRRLLRDVDTVSRIGEARFGVILEGVDARTSVTERAARLIAAGLMPLKGLKPEVTLQFHIASVLLDERVMEPLELVDALSDLLAGMSPRTRRPIRFLEPENTHPAPLGADSSMIDDVSRPLPRQAPENVVPIGRNAA